RIFLLIVLVSCLPQLASAQLGRWGDETEGDLDSMIRSGRFSPFIEVNYGLAKPRFEGYEGSFNTLGVMELKLGFAALDSVRAALVSLDDRYAFVSYIGQDIRPSGEADEGEVGSELARFGFGNRLGYGYGRKGLTFEMYNQNSLNWTKLTPLQYDTMDSEAQAIFDRYENTFRFGQLMEAGVKVHVARSIALSVGAEGAVIFPRTVFWPWLGSAMIYSGVQGGLQYFSEAIIDTSPVIGPALHFLLKSAVSYGYYMVLREDMAWPFDYETPMTVESFKLGASITF
ncbi:MAG: hypothetical protein KAH56_14005, partial [Candidatus Krumholzibacteria bacterium]|nr:hypothetical protein [Candidatus Krumholzibacteria bacterium]